MNDILNRYLCKKELADLLSLSYQSIYCETEDNLKKLILDLKNLVGFENANCVQAKIPGAIFDPTVKKDVLDVSYPAGFLDTYIENGYHLTDPVLCEFLTHLSPVNWMNLVLKLNYYYPAVTLALDHKMVDGWCHGTIDPGTMICTLISLGGPCPDNNVRSQKILEYIIPFYAEAYTRVLKRAFIPAKVLTNKEIEVLHWIKEGKSSWEISMILKCSKRGVDFNVNNIKIKLSAVSRPQAVAIGLQRGIIQF